MDMFDVSTRKKKSSALYFIEALLGASDELSDGNDLTSKLRWQLFEESKVLSRDNLDVALSDWEDIQEREHIVVFKNNCA
jgi:hypothetical protein